MTIQATSTNPLFGITCSGCRELAPTPLVTALREGWSLFRAHADDPLVCPSCRALPTAAAELKAALEALDVKADVDTFAHRVDKGRLAITAAGAAGISARGYLYEAGAAFTRGDAAGMIEEVRKALDAVFLAMAEQVIAGRTALAAAGGA